MNIKNPSFKNKKLYLIMIFFLLFATSLQGQEFPYVSTDSNSSKTSTINNTPISELLLNSTEVKIASGTSISLKLRARGWNFEIANSRILSTDNYISLVSVEEDADSTNFIFFRLEAGNDLLHFKRFDSEKSVIYNYDLRIDWLDKMQSPLASTSIFKDKYLEINSIPLDQALQHNAKKALEEDKKIMNSNSMADAQLETKSSTNKNTGAPLSTKPKTDAINDSKKDTNMMTKSEANNTKSPLKIDTIQNNLTNTNTIDENQILNNLSSQQSSLTNAAAKQKQIDPKLTQDSKLNLGQTMSDDQANNSDQTLMEIKEIKDMNIDEFKTYLTSNWDTKTYEENMTQIQDWIHTHDDMFNSANLYWIYAKHIEDNFKRPENIQQVVSMYRYIVDNYPLSYEYFDAKNRLEFLKIKYVFVLE